MADRDSMRRQDRAAEAVAQPEVVPSAMAPPHEPASTAFRSLETHEIRALLDELLAAGWAGTRLEKAWLGAMLWRHLGRLDAASDRRRNPVLERAVAPPDAPPPAAAELERLARRLREALPRLQHGALRYDLGEVLRMLERDLRRHAMSRTHAREDHGLANFNQGRAQRAELHRVVPNGTDREP